MNVSEIFNNIGFNGLNEYLQIFLIILASLVSEDATLGLTTVFNQSGQINSYVYILGNGLGLLIGDTLLYLVGLYLSKKNKPILGIDPSEFNVDKHKNKSRQFLVIALSRFVPGARLPTYCFAGYSQFPYYLFFIAKVITIPIWLALFYVFGFIFIEFLQSHSWLAIIFVVFLYLLYKNLKSTLGSKLNIPFKIKLLAFFHGLKKNFYYEFWPSIIFYLPSAFFCLIQMILHRFKVIVPSSVNPGITNGGIVLEKKTDCCDLIKDDEFKLKQQNIPLNLNQEEKLDLVKDKFSYPYILKPEFGQRGAGVSLISNETDAKNYFKNSKYEIMAQEYCSHDLEAGIFYIRYPNQKNGFIFSVTDKSFPQVIGDGKSTLAELIIKDKRARLIAIKYFERHKEKLNQVLDKGKVFRLVGAGGHTQGAEFKDGYKKLYDQNILNKFDEISKKMEGFYFGRFDVRYKSVEDFKAGTNFKIIELNGGTSEATHIHDHKINIIEVYKVLYIQTRHLYKIAYINKTKGYKSISLMQFIKHWVKFIRMYSKYKTSY